MDAFFFFLIVSGLALFLLSFGTNYGLSLDEQTEKEQFREYVSSALKVILYSSTPRDPLCSLEECPSSGNPPEEIDFLMAAIKEDFADDGGLDETGKKLKDMIRAIMQPLGDSVDYAFYLYMPDQIDNQIPYFLFYKSEFDPANCPGVEQECHVFQYCKPLDRLAMDQFFFTLPGVSRTSSRTVFLSAPIVPGPRPDQVESEVHFAVWSSIRLDDKPGPDKPNYPAFAGLDCCIAGTPGCTAEEKFVGPGVQSGVAFLFPPSTTLYQNADGSFNSRTLKFEIKNESSFQLSNLQISNAPDASFNCMPAWVSGPVTIPPMDAAIEVAKVDFILGSSDAAKSHIDEGFWVHLTDEDLEWNQSNESKLVAAVYDASEDFSIRLFKKEFVSVTVKSPDADPPVNRQCKFQLSFSDPGGNYTKNRFFIINRVFQ